MIISPCNCVNYKLNKSVDGSSFVGIIQITLRDCEIMRSKSNIPDVE